MNYKKNSAGRDGLLETEIFWRDQFTWLQEQGYQLRPRFAPNWVPSWIGSDKPRMRFEDGQNLVYAQVNDALHVPTGSRVALKRVNAKIHPYEEDIMRHLSSEALSTDPRNHCAHLIDVLQPPLNDGTNDIRILVMPFLRPFDSPAFDTFGEAIECIRQLFEGVLFMHENHVAHRDLKLNNFMINGEKMFPDGHHPKKNLLKLDMSGPAKCYTRTQQPSKYFLIDFGFSRQYDAKNLDPLEPTFIIGGAKGETELENSYMTDVYHLGELVRQGFLDGHPVLTHIRGYRGFEFLRPLIEEMIQTDPSKRPKSDEVVNRFEDLVNGLTAWKLRSRTSSRRANIVQNISHMFSHWTRRVAFMIKGTPAIPRVS